MAGDEAASGLGVGAAAAGGVATPVLTKDVVSGPDSVTPMDLLGAGAVGAASGGATTTVLRIGPIVVFIPDKLCMASAPCHCGHLSCLNTKNCAPYIRWTPW